MPGLSLIEPSVLPFGRHRWVSATGPAGPLDVADTRPPGELGDWIDERSQLPVDPVRGPGWHLGMLPMSDGSTAVTLVLSHCLLDGGASLRTGDLYASGTVSGPERQQRGCLLELSWNGTEPLQLPDGTTRTFLEDGDTVTMTAWAPGPNGSRVGLGEVGGTILPSR